MGRTTIHRSRHNDDDIDDFMASLIHSDDSTHPSAERKPLPLRETPLHQTAPKHVSKHVTPSKPAAPAKQKAPSSPLLKRRLFRPVLAVMCILIAAAGGIALWRGPVSSLMQPKSPFTQEVQERMSGIPLYFPTQLPTGFKIELDSISQPEAAVVIYAISDNAGKRINIALQKQPADINLEPLHAVLTKTRDVQTRFGSVKTGVSEEGVQITNILAGQTWVIITSAPDTIGDQDLIRLIDSLREG